MRFYCSSSAFPTVLARGAISRAFPPFGRQPGVIMTSEQNPASKHSAIHPTIHPSSMQHASASRGSHRIYYAQSPLEKKKKQKQQRPTFRRALKLLDNLCTSSCSLLLAKFRFCLNLNLSPNNNSQLAHSSSAPFVVGDCI